MPKKQVRQGEMNPKQFGIVVERGCNSEGQPKMVDRFLRLALGVIYIAKSVVTLTDIKLFAFLWESTEKMSVGCGELISAVEPTVVTKPLFDAIVMENGQDDGCLADPTSANLSDWREALCEIDDILNQLVASEDPWWWRW